MHRTEERENMKKISNGIKSNNYCYYKTITILRVIQKCKYSNSNKTFDIFFEF